MGTTKFLQIYNNLVKQEKNRKKVTNYHGKIIIIDGHFQLYRTRIGKIGREEIIFNGKNVSHIYDIFVLSTQMISRGAIPVFFFDGSGITTEKKACTEKRNEIKNKAQEKYELSDDKTSEESIKQKKKSYRITPEILSDCCTLLKKMKIRYVVCDKEADQQCVAVYNYYADKMPDRIGGIMSDDTDMFLYGGRKVLKNFSISSNSTYEITRNSLIEYLQEKINFVRIQQNLPPIVVKFKNFVDFSILMGTDYFKTSNCKIQNLNKLLEVFAINDLNVEKTIEQLKITPGFSVPNNFLFVFEQTRNVYRNPQVIHPEDINIIPEILNDDDIQELIHYLCVENGIEYGMVHDRLNILVRNVDKFIADFNGPQDNAYSNFGSYRKKYFYVKSGNRKDIKFNTNNQGGILVR